VLHTKLAVKVLTNCSPLNPEQHVPLERGRTLKRCLQKSDL
jgi:hypothetical protein